MLPNSENICSVDMFSTQTKFLVSCFAPATENKQNRAAMSDLWSAVRTLAKYGTSAYCIYLSQLYVGLQIGGFCCCCFAGFSL